MPPARTARLRAVQNENDENVASRLSRVKAVVNGDVDELSSGAVRKALGAKKTTNVSNTAVTRKRGALTDATNIGKSIQNGDAKENKKPAAAKALLPSKTMTQTAGITKSTRTSATRPALNPRDQNAKTASQTRRASGSELKRPADIAEVTGGVQKKRSNGLTSTTNIYNGEDTENSPPEESKTSLQTSTKPTATQTTRAKYETETPELAEAKQEEIVPDLDADDFEDPLMVHEYVVEIFEYLRELEEKTSPNPDYIQFQTHVTWAERDVLTNWLVEVHESFRLLPETLYLTINIVDRFLSRRLITLDRLQLVGITAMFIASKYEEVMSPHVSNFAAVSHDYTEAEVLEAERHILEALNYDLSFPNPLNFLRRISKADDYDPQTRTLGKYLLEIYCLDHKLLKYNPSHVAATAMFMSRMILGRGPWSATLAHYSGYTEAEIQPVFAHLLAYCAGPVPHQALFAKYGHKRYLKASIIVRNWARRWVQKSMAAEAERLSHSKREASLKNEVDSDNEYTTVR